MEDTLLKIGEFGALGIIALFLLTKGTASIKELSDAQARASKELADSNKNLADAVAKLSDKVSSLDSRVVTFEYELRSIGTRLEKIESTLASLIHKTFSVGEKS